MRRIVFIFFVICSLNAQAFKHANFQVIDVKAGLSDNYVHDILNDRNGFMWFATHNGLNCYDGYHFKHYTTEQLGAYDNNILRVWEDSSGTIWIKTHGNYYFYNREKDKLENTIQTKLKSMGIHQPIEQLFIDEDRNLWCSTNNTLHYFQFSENTLNELNIPIQTTISDMNCRNKKAYLLLNNGNIVHVDWENKNLETITHINHDFSNLAPHIYVDKKGHIWIYTTHGNEIGCYSIENNEWIAFPGQEVLSKEHCNITALSDDGKGNIWIGTDSRGIIISHFQEQTYTRLHKGSNMSHSLPSNHITSIYQDKNNLIWVGTGKQGVSYTNLHKINIKNHPSIKFEDISSLIEDQDGNLWIGLDGEGITKYDVNNKTNIHYRQASKSIPSDLIVCSYLDSQNRLWWGTFGGGAFYYQNGAFNTPEFYTNNSKSENPYYIRRITEDSSKNIWMATYAQGLCKWEPTGNIKSYTTENTDLLTNYIADLSCRDGKILYIATGSGVYRMNTETDFLTEIRHKRTGKTLMPDNFANCIFEDSRGLIWVGGRKEVCAYNPQNDFITYISTNDGLSHPKVKAITEDNNHNIWISTDHGITYVVVNHKSEGNYTLECYPYYKEDGLGNYTFNNFSIFCNNKGNILIGGAGGYVEIDPNIVPHHNYNHRIVYTGLYLNENRVEVDKPEEDGRVLLNKNMQLTDIIQLDYSDRHFSVEVSSMEYGELHKLQYVYRLNKNEKWYKLDGNRIYFNNLAPGKYMLEVKVKEDVKSTNNPTSTLIIHVQPPFWLSTMAYIIYLIVFIFLVSLFVLNFKRKHLKMLRQQKRELEISQKQEINEAKLRFYTNISHDLRTPLTLIISPIEKLLQSNLSIPEIIRKDLDLMYRNSLLLLDVVNQLLDLRRIEKGKVQLNLSHGNLSEFINDICSSFQPYETKRNIHLEIDIQEENLETDFDRNKMLRIMMNLLSNAFKYNIENGKVTITIKRIVNENNQSFACLIVSDTGIGIKEENKEKIFDLYYQEKQSYDTTYASSGIGMHIVKEYVSLHGGTICIEDNEPQGTKFIISLPIKKGQKNNILSMSSLPTFIPEKSKDMKVSVLIVEDNDDFRHFLSNFLKDYFITIEASNGEEALSLIEQHEINFIICDIRMPGINGLELCQRIKNDIKYSHIPVMLLTARTNEEHIMEGLREGADEYITKPVNLGILLLRINRILEWTKNNHKKIEKEAIIPSEITMSQLDNQLITKIMDYININMDNSEFSVEELSEEVGLSRGHLYKKMMSIVGKSPQEFIRIMRIRKGKELLDNNADNISQIAYQIGLSPKLFAKYFKEEYGCSPSTYLKEGNKL